MSANEFGRETHWQIVRTDFVQQWHARLVSNYRTIMTSETYTRRASALRAIELAAPEWLASKTPLEVDERGKTPPPSPRPGIFTVTSGSEYLRTQNTGSNTAPLDWNVE